ncbi:hypothetical protein [Lichenibacterium dinghuense]|uniref:hypothetical protein n=1 Tax=Lichenibacterium dinghuense TaxID=2895977 RepID=UPI001F24DA18|nr:hypothetical protein [Lichenibacterium sp. 6Y81]
MKPAPASPNVPTARTGETTDQLAHRIQNLNPSMRSVEYVGLAWQAAGIKEGFRDWRAGGKVSDGSMPIGTPIATFMDRHGNQSDRYDGG